MNRNEEYKDNDKISMKNIDAYYDTFDKACMLLVEKCGINYLNAFLRVHNDIKSGEINKKGLSDKDLLKLESIEELIINSYFLNEEIRQALLLIMIKGIKHVNGKLDVITPDFISYIFAFIIQNLFEKEIKKEKMEHISILDINLGTSNLINLISNNISIESELIGIEIDEGMSMLSAAFSDLQGNDISIYNNSCLDYMMLSANAIIGDLDCKMEDGKYLPYEAIIKYQETNVDRSFMIFLVDNDFFMKKELKSFKERFKGTLIGLITLPQEMFKKQGKSILIISPKKYKNVDTLALNLPSARDELAHREALIELRQWLRKF